MLTAEEQAELDQLNAVASAPKGGLTPDEERELAELNASAGSGDSTSSPITAATTGLIKGAAPFGIAGALAGAGKTAMDAITGIRGPLAGGSFSDLADDYVESRDSFNNDAAKAAEANPVVSAAANVAGAAANPIGSAALGRVGDFIKNRVASKAAVPLIEKSASWARNDETKRQVYMAIAKKLGKRALAGTAAGAVLNEVIGGR